jgi:ADP-ribose pyrophosphatase YjhB (NUDIX family)
MNQSDPLKQLEALHAREGSARAAERARVRAISPELTAVMDSLGHDARMRHITVDGITVAGKPPPEDPSSWCVISGEFAEAGMRMGWKR